MLHTVYWPHPPIGGHQGCFQSGAVKDQAAVTFLIHGYVHFQFRHTVRLPSTYALVLSYPANVGLQSQFPISLLKQAFLNLFFPKPSGKK